MHKLFAGLHGEGFSLSIISQVKRTPTSPKVPESNCPVCVLLQSLCRCYVENLLPCAGHTVESPSR